MTTREKVEELLRQTAELPEEAQVDFMETLVEMRSRQMGIYHLDEEERRALAESAEDERLGRFASDEEIKATFARYGA